jgi:hypothetical protein
MKRTSTLITVFVITFCINNSKAQTWLTNSKGINYNGGNVGIGTSSPYGKLHIFSQNSPSQYYDGELHIGGFIGNSEDITLIIGTHYTNKTTFLQGWRAGYGSTPILLQPQGGNIGIGTTTPPYKLTISNTGGLGLEFDPSGVQYGEGFGMQVYNRLTSNYQPLQIYASKILLNGGNVGIGTTTPLVGLHVTKTVNYNGIPIAAIFGNNYFDWTQFGGLTAGRIRGSNEGYLVVEGNPTGTGDKSLYLNYSTNGNVIIATGGGNVGIGTSNPGNYRLAVEGTIGAREVKITTSTWSDFVFHPTYKLRTLEEVEQFIKANNHLPEIPTETEVKQNGVGLGEMNAKLLQKIEELTLYLIEQKKENEKQNEKQNQLIKELEQKIENISNKQ